MVARAVPARSDDLLLRVWLSGYSQIESPAARRFPIGASSVTS